MDGFQIFTEFVTGALALATFFMVWKTKTLTDVVSEMSKQTLILSKRLDVEISLANPQRYPSLIIQNLREAAPTAYYLSLLNIGQYATHFYATDLLGGISIDRDRGISYGVIFSENRDVGITINFNTEKLPESFSFTLNYKDGYGSLMNQKVKYKHPDIGISPPNLLSI